MFRSLLLLICFLLPSFSFAGETVRVMSFNLRFGEAKDGDNHWNKRDWLVAKTVKQFNPDLMGTQETLKFQAEYLQKELRDYTYFGRSRMKKPNEHCGIFYKTNRFTQLAGGHFWLSESPEVPESKSWDSSLPRMASWVLLSDNNQENARPILFVNTHFDHRGRVARLESAKLIRQRIEKLQKIANQPYTIVTGDFNTPEGSKPYSAFLDGNDELVDTYRKKHKEREPTEGTFNGFRGTTRGGRIDWILASKDLVLKDAQIDRTNEDGRYPSDHFPVTAEFEVPTMLMLTPQGVQSLEEEEPVLSGKLD